MSSEHSAAAPDDRAAATINPSQYDSEYRSRNSESSQQDGLGQLDDAALLEERTIQITHLRFRD